MASVEGVTASPEIPRFNVKLTGDRVVEVRKTLTKIVSTYKPDDGGYKVTHRDRGTIGGPREHYLDACALPSCVRERFEGKYNKEEIL